MTPTRPDLVGPLLAGSAQGGVIYDLGTGKYMSPSRLAAEVIGWSPDGCHVLFRGHDSRLYNAHVSGQSLLVMVPDSSWQHPVWSPSGEWIAYDRGALEAGTRAGNEVYIVSADGQRRVQLTDNFTADYVLGWTLDGAAVIIWSEGDQSPILYAMDIQTRAAQLLGVVTFQEAVTDLTGLAFFPGPWILSPDKTLVRLLLEETDGWGNVHWAGVMDLRSGEHRILHDGVYAEFGSSWSPDSKRVAFGARHYDDNSREKASVYLQDVLTGEVVVLDTTAIASEGDSYPSWAPGGTAIAVQGWPRPFVTNLETGSFTQLTSDLYGYYPLIWSPRAVYADGACP